MTTSTASQPITGLLSAWCEGSPDALAALMPLTYRQLKHIAANLLRGERRQSLETTALVHEAYLRLQGLERVRWQDRAHFYAMSSRIMRRVLIDEARRLTRSKRAGEEVKISLQELSSCPQVEAPELLGLHQALTDLAKLDPQRAQVVEMRYFGGMSQEQIALVLGVSVNTVARRWRSARAWLVRYFEAVPNAGEAPDP